MQCTELKYHWFTDKLYLFLLAFVFFFSQNSGLAQDKKEKKKEQHFDVEIGLGTTYDDNILKYSEKYLERFMNNEDEGRFHIDTYDDIILNPSIKLIATYNIFGKLRTKINGDFSRRQYVVNNIKSWNYVSFGIQQYLTKRASFKLYYSNIPDFYVRHFRDDQWVEIYGYTPETFQPFSFAKNNFGIYAQNTFFKSTRIKLTFNYAEYFHNKHFTQYDSKNFSYAIDIYQNVGKNIKLDAGYEFETSDAKGYDASHETPETTNGPDASYVEDAYNFDVNWQLPRLYKHKHDFDASVSYATRYYSSEHPLELDREHAGRYDKNLRFYVTYTFEINKQMDVAAFYNWMGRDTETTAIENTEYLSNEKDYKQNLVGIEFTYKFKL